MTIRQGDVFWIDLGEPSGSAPAYRHPHVVLQNNLFNRSKINTVVVCAVTSTLRRAKAPGNVLLQKGEANLMVPSVVNVSQIFTVDKSDCVEKIGSVTDEVMREILHGVTLLLEPRNIDNLE